MVLIDDSSHSFSFQLTCCICKGLNDIIDKKAICNSQRPISKTVLSALARWTLKSQWVHTTEFYIWLLLNPKPRVLAWWVMFLWSFGNPGSFLLPSPLTSRTSEFSPFNRRREERKWKDAWRCFMGGAWRWWPMLSFSTARVAGKCSPAVWPRSRETRIQIWVCVTKGCTNAWEYSGSEWAQQGLGLYIKVIFVFKKLWQSSAPPPGTVSLFRQGYNALFCPPVLVASGVGVV